MTTTEYKYAPSAPSIEDEPNNKSVINYPQSTTSQYQSSTIYPYNIYGSNTHSTCYSSPHNQSFNHYGGHHTRIIAEPIYYVKKDNHCHKNKHHHHDDDMCCVII